MHDGVDDGSGLSLSLRAGLMIQNFLQQYLAAGAANDIPVLMIGTHYQHLKWHYQSVMESIKLVAYLKLGVRLETRQVDLLLGSYFRARFGRMSCAVAGIPDDYP